METIARSKLITGPYEPNSANPILTITNTTEFFQAVGHQICSRILLEIGGVYRSHNDRVPRQSLSHGL
jgi:hypothetical protein